ncbi:MAG TPA: tetratricopeptide repeat protein, partial [Anaerolineae bacterium]|nr:tetratricopeptide repeat protein [Anaerolineae bacterium]
ADPDGLLEKAKRRLAELERQAQLQELYERAVGDMEAGAWDEARDLLARLHDMEPDFRDTGLMLAKVEAEISRRDAEFQRQAELRERYALAQAAEEAGDWAAAFSALESLIAEAPDYEDAAARLEVVRQRQRQASKPRTLPPDRQKPKKPPKLPDDSRPSRPEKPTSLPS